MMNPTHAQFFRELRELCKRYSMIIESDEPSISFRTGCSGPTYRVINFYGHTESVTVLNEEKFDAAQKEGEK